MAERPRTAAEDTQISGRAFVIAVLVIAAAITLFAILIRGV